MKGISIIICCYNSAKRLPVTLAHLAKQQVDAGFDWEVILINNNSNDNTSILAEQIWESLGVPTSLEVDD